MSYILDELLQCASRKWESDSNRVYTSRESRLKPLDQWIALCWHIVPEV